MKMITMKYTNTFSLIAFFVVSFVYAQVDSLEVQTDSLLVEEHIVYSDSLVVSPIYNPEFLGGFMEKLKALDSLKDRKINIVHIGDSHIQADVMTDALRQNFQARFGNAGLGFVFPHSLAQTNGSSHLRFASNSTWDSHRNVFPNNGSPVGLSGIALHTTQNNFAIELAIRTENYHFNDLKIITPDNQLFFDAAKATQTIVLRSTPKTITHKIKNGETLSGIAQRYKTTVTQIKQSNGLRNNNIRAGASLKIPTKEMEPQKIEQTAFEKLNIEPVVSDYYYHYQNLESTDKIYLIPNNQYDNFALNGIVLENNQSGVLYHSIGVNGAKFSDYNKYQLFFEQINALEPDLIVISLGTNEAFDKLCNDCFYNQIEAFLLMLRKQNSEVAILFTTPPPALFHRKQPNTFCEALSEVIISNSLKDKYSVWDLYREMGGNQSMQQLINQGIIARDRVHYSSGGYKKQGNALFEALMITYQNYLNFESL